MKRKCINSECGEFLDHDGVNCIKFIDTELESSCSEFIGHGDLVVNICSMRKAITTLEAENKSLREALAFYADDSTYEWDLKANSCTDATCDVIEDDGEIATLALTPKSEGEQRDECKM